VLVLFEHKVITGKSLRNPTARSGKIFKNYPERTVVIRPDPDPQGVGGVSPTSPNHCRPATGTASASCRLGTRTDLCLRLLDVRSSVGSHPPSATDAGSAVVSDNQPQSLERLKFLQDGTVTWAVPGVSRQVYPPSVPVPAPLGDDRQELDLTTGKRSVTHGASPG